MDNQDEPLDIPLLELRNRVEAGLFNTVRNPVEIEGYLVIKKIGQGSMGVVYEAYEPQLRRVVALKQLRPGPAYDADGKRRLEREAQAMAQIAHENVVRVHRLLWSDGLPILVMELVDGQSLTAWLQTPRSAIEVIDMFVQAGRGLSAAHRCGIIHRDFKPDNVMVSNDGCAKVTDFGLARHETAVSDVVSGTPSGTLAYMAPESVKHGEFGPKTDQYSFCVAMWQALLGESFQSRQTLDNDLPVERSELRGLEWLTRELELGLGDPEQRWSSMDELLDQIEQVRRRHDPAAIRRRRRFWGVSLAVAASIGLGMGAVHMQKSRQCEQEGASIARTWNSDQREKVRAAFSATNLPFAADMANVVEAEIGEYVENWGRTRTENCRAFEIAREIDEGEADAVRACLDERRMGLETAIDMLSDPTPGDVQFAARIVTGLPIIDHCANPFSRPRYFNLPADPAANAEAREISALLAQVGAHEDRGDYEAGYTIGKEASRRADALGWAPLRVRTSNSRGFIEYHLHRYAEAEETLENSYFDALGDGNKEAAYVAASHLVAVVGSDTTRIDDALRWSKTALALLDAAGAPGHDLRRAGVRNDLAIIYRENADYAKALDATLDSLRIYEHNLGTQHPGLVRPYTNLGNIYDQKGESQKALEMHLHALALAENTLSEFHPWAASILVNLGNASQDFDSKRQYYERAIHIFEAIGPGERVKHGGALLGMSSVYESAGEYDLARENATRAIEIFREALGDDHPNVGKGLTLLGHITKAQGDYDAALEQYTEVLSIFEAALGGEHPDFAMALSNRALALQELGRYDEASADLTRALSIVETQHGPDHPDVALLLHNLGVSARRRGDLDECLELNRRAMAIHETRNGPDYVLLVGPLESIGLVHLELGSMQEAAASFEKALSIYRASGQNEPTKLGDLSFGVARATRSDPQKARELALAAREYFQLAGKGQQHRVDEIDAWLKDEELGDQ